MSFTVWAPGRVNLIGEHTDYSGGRVLPVAIQLGITLDVEGEADGVDLGPYADAVFAELDASVGFHCTVSSTLPIGAGLSSSAAFCVAVGLALCEVAGRRLDPLELADACRRAEHRAVGAPVGILDPAAVLLCEEGHALLLDCGTLEHRLVRVPDEAALVVADSGVKHSHATSGYADRRAELEAGMPPRVRHVETENARVLAFVDALERGDLRACGELLLQSHASLRDDYEVSVPEVDALVERAVAAGALGARIVGGGFGGAVLALIETARAQQLADELGGFVARASRGAGVGPRGLTRV